jgi:hypothetical protein
MSKVIKYILFQYLDEKGAEELPEDTKVDG